MSGVATREAYGKALVELGKLHEDMVVLDADLANATKTQYFKDAFPDRFVDCGIAEADMTGIAAGLATCGKVPFMSSFAMFAAGRNYEQVRNSIGYPHLNVKIGATHAGISVGEDGATHQCLEDLALMREIPGMTVMCPADDIEAVTTSPSAHVMKEVSIEGEAYLCTVTVFGGDMEKVTVYTINVQSTATGIQTLTKPAEGKAAYFTLDGRKLDSKPTQRGVYIMNGKKFKN